MLVPRRSHACVTYKYHTFVIGGCNDEDDRLGVIGTYGPVWRECATLTAPRRCVAASVLGDMIYIAGNGAPHIDCLDP
jgi:hypothetical protein